MGEKTESKQEVRASQQKNRDMECTCLRLLVRGAEVKITNALIVGLVVKIDLPMPYTRDV